MPGSKLNYLFENNSEDKIEIINKKKTKKVSFHPIVKIIKVECFKRYNKK
jgi:hypothetical protein